MKFIEPIDNKIVIKPDAVSEKSKGGILLPDKAQEKPVMGEVVAVGPGLPCIENGTRMPMQLKVGDVVFYSKYAGQDIDVDDETYKVMREEDVLVRVRLAD